MISYVGFNDHGGECCGIVHIAGFSSGDKDLQQQHLGRVDDILNNERFENVKYEHSPVCGKLFEIVLNDEQIRRMPILCKGLKERGFKLVSRFDNRSGSWCNVLHRRPQNAIHSSPYWEK